MYTLRRDELLGQGDAEGGEVSRLTFVGEAGKKALEAGAARLAPCVNAAEAARTVGGEVRKAGFKTGLWGGHAMGMDLATVSACPRIIRSSFLKARSLRFILTSCLSTAGKGS